MPVFPPPAAIERPKSGHGGGVHPPGFGGGDDNGPGDSSPDYGRRLYRARLALVLALFSISMLFVILTVVFLFLHHGAFVFDSRANAYIREWVQVSLPVRLLALNTIVLLVSSFTIEMSRRSLGREMALDFCHSMVGVPEQECSLMIEAYYGDFVAPGKEGPGAWAEIDFNSPLATRLDKDWSYLGIA